MSAFGTNAQTFEIGRNNGGQESPRREARRKAAKPHKSLLRPLRQLAWSAMVRYVP